MTSSIPSLDDIADTVRRMEARLQDAPQAQSLFEHYTLLNARFAADLADPRDAQLACSAALMLIQETVRGTEP
ncbi:hypothetical protein E4K72_13240 [Oxalobacteraceae bacterium OM1]|nr:hypothetical protein E4K72_13240 [Oxalobacteraceae bacterium OM1]